LSAEIVLDYAIFKRKGTMGAKLNTLLKVLEVLPISSAECEHGFSQMNLYHTSSRNRLLTETVGDLMMVGVNGPPITHWNATKYVVSWLQSGKHGALDKPRGIAKKEVEVPKSYQLFA
jgi:hypothetical protein